MKYYSKNTDSIRLKQSYYNPENKNLKKFKKNYTYDTQTKLDSEEKN